MANTTTRSVSSNNGIGLGGAIFLVFLVLKLLGKITWSWWWVTAPLWIGWGFVLALFAIIAVIAILVTALRR